MRTLFKKLLKSLMMKFAFELLREVLYPKIQVHVLPRGRLPERKSDGAIGYDCYIRAVVSSFKMDSDKPYLRKTLFDFENMPEDAKELAHTHKIDGKYVYRLHPGESVLIGIGFVTAMPYPMFYWVTPRSGLATKYGITVTNSPGTVDPDYRGEAGVLILNRRDTYFDLEYEMRISQVVFQWAILPTMISVDSIEKLSKTDRGAGGFGSTGHHKDIQS